MEPKLKGQEGKIIASPIISSSDADSSKNKDKSSSENDHPKDPESSHNLEDNKTVKSSNSKPKRSGVSPLAELALLNKSIYLPSVSLPAVESSHEGGTAVDVNKTPATACLSVKRMKPVPAPVESDQSPPVVRRGRGRPRKNAVTPVTENKKSTVEEDTSKSVSESESSFVVEESEKITVKTTSNDSPRVVSDTPVPVKRGRGRPPKNKSADLWSPPGARARSPPKSGEVSPIRFPHRYKSPKEGTGDLSSSRPLTRGALGKDFPSAKKRSWIDVEKELEPEIESE
ncbi:uncharacterized protein LOC121963497 [Plectropomus leopardus]|uniref:uncharacterized protein LOC121963497 n=1 Tax=Plectropomus leopardus TaxID=160734 RepID=UPI001C4AD49B|nr:uncharacterized protein LOC121963497 [Plectropomus leopardus]